MDKEPCKSGVKRTAAAKDGYRQGLRGFGTTRAGKCTGKCTSRNLDKSPDPAKVERKRQLLQKEAAGTGSAAWEALPGSSALA